MASSQIPKQTTPPRRAKIVPTTLQAHGRRLVPASFDMPALLERLTDLLGLLAQSAPMMIFLHDPASNQYTLHRTQGWMAPEESDFGFSPDSGIAHWLGAHEHPLYLKDNQGQPPPPLDTIGMVLFLPLRAPWGLPEDRPAGWVALGPRPTGEPYSPDDLRLMSTLVDQAAFAIENRYLSESIAELEQAQVEFVDFVAHELKQPMTSMQGYAKMLMMGIGGELSERQSQFVQIIDASVNRMGKLVNDLLEISRLEAGRVKLKLEQIQPREIVEQALTNIRAEMDARDHSLEVNVPGDLPPLTGDRKRLLQILAHLLSNACMYTPDGGRISVSVSGPERGGAPSAHLLFRISDTGIGMSSEDLASLDKFFRADHDLVVSQPGTGLGVSIARHLVELHGGELMIESALDRGSTFRFTIPTAEGTENVPPLPLP
jgi:signal transduction histidine kinase